MNSHQKRLILGFVIAVLVLTALFLLLEKIALAITAWQTLRTLREEPTEVIQ